MEAQAYRLGLMWSKSRQFNEALSGPIHNVVEDKKVVLSLSVNT